MNETIGSRISKYRKEKGMTQEELASRLGVSSQAVSKWENDLSCPDISLLPALCQALGVTSDEMLTGKTN